MSQELTGKASWRRQARQEPVPMSNNADDKMEVKRRKKRRQRQSQGQKLKQPWWKSRRMSKRKTGSSSNCRGAGDEELEN